MVQKLPSGSPAVSRSQMKSVKNGQNVFKNANLQNKMGQNDHGRLIEVVNKVYHVL